jgi:hypothetical protein
VLLEVEVEVLEDEVYALLVVHHVLQPARQQKQSISPSIHSVSAAAKSSPNPDEYGEKGDAGRGT